MLTTQPYIFLVDDSEDDRQLFLEALDELNLKATITTFENGVDLMANLMDSSITLPDIIFLDLYMPLMNGEECLVDIRSNPQLCDIPIIIYSGYHDEHKIKFLKEKGANCYLEKPNTFEKLKHLVDYCIKSLGQENYGETRFVFR